MTKPVPDREEILALYIAGPTQLEELLAVLSVNDLDKALDSENWTIRQIVHHIADGDDLWKTSIKWALGNPSEQFNLKWYWDRTQMDWAECWKYSSRPVEPSLALLKANRQCILDILRQHKDGWEKSVPIRWPHGKEERITVGNVIEMQAHHLVDHIRDIVRIQQAHGS